jgi:hypothetical protein
MLPVAVRGATIPFVENFDLYIQGTSTDKVSGSWKSTCGTSRFWTSGEDYSQGGQSQQHTIWRTGCDNLYRIGEPVAVGKMAVDFKFYNTTGGYLDIQLFNSSLGVGFSHRVNYNHFTGNLWHTFYYEWRENNESRWAVDTFGWSAWTSSTNWQYVDKINFNSNNSPSGSYVYLDNIRYESRPNFVFPDNPVNCQINPGIDFANILVNGRVEIPPEDSRTFTKLTARFQVATSSIILYDWEFYLPSLRAGQSYSYSSTGSMPTSTYRVSYILAGYDTTYKAFTQYEYCEGTFICPGTCAPEIVSELQDYEKPVLDDCSALSGVEKWLCEIKVLIAGAVVPSTSTIGELKANIDLLKTKAPGNYLTATQQFFTNLKTQSSVVNSLPFELLGQTGNVSFAFWEKTGEINGVSFSFRTIFYDFFSFVVIIIFGFWGLNYLKRIFK